MFHVYDAQGAMLRACSGMSYPTAGVCHVVCHAANTSPTGLHIGSREVGFDLAGCCQLCNSVEEDVLDGPMQLDGVDVDG
jgi:hypothetical protein